MSALRAVCGATLRQITRQRMALLLFFVLPPLLLGIVVLTSRADQSFGFTLPALRGAPTLFASPRELTLLFVGLAAAGLFTSFVALSAIQENAEADRRLTLLGLDPVTTALGRALALLVVSATAACFICALVWSFLPSARMGLVALALFHGAIVYGAFGLVVGALLRGRLEGVLVIALVVQLDAGWLQNPVYYADATSSAVLHALPAYLPSQSALAGAFGGPSPGAPLAWSSLYALVLLAIAVVTERARAARPRRVEPRAEG
jgi:hypothetical protein